MQILNLLLLFAWPWISVNMFLDYFSLCCSDWVIATVIYLSSQFFSLFLTILLLSPSIKFLFLLLYSLVLKYLFGPTSWWDNFFFICYKYSHSDSLRYFYNGYFKIFFRYFQHLRHLGFGTCLLSCLTQIGILLVLGILNDFLLYPGHFWYHAMRLEISFKSVLASLVWHCIRREMRVPPHCYQGGVNVLAPHLVSVDSLK